MYLYYQKWFEHDKNNWWAVKMIAQLSGTTKFQQKVHQIQFFIRTSISDESMTADGILNPSYESVIL